MGYVYVKIFLGTPVHLGASGLLRIPCVGGRTKVRPYNAVCYHHVEKTVAVIMSPPPFYTYFNVLRSITLRLRQSS